MSSEQTEHERQLREWAEGILSLEAATELLIRGGQAAPGLPWVRYDEIRKRPWIDFARIPEAIGPMAGGEQRFLRVAASLGADVPVILGDELAGLDRDELELVLAAVAHAGGVHVPGRVIDVHGDAPRIVSVDALYTWPAVEGEGDRG